MYVINDFQSLYLLNNKTRIIIKINLKNYYVTPTTITLIN